MATFRDIGSVYEGGVVQHPGAVFDGRLFSIGDTVPGFELAWVSFDGLLIADRCLWFGMSWKQLYELGYVFGVPVRIDGEPFNCRCMKLDPDDKKNEWDRFLGAFGAKNSFWHWQDGFFVGQETETSEGADGTKLCVIRGHQTARYWEYCPIDDKSPKVGFRPVLEPLPPEKPLEELLGSDVRIWGPQGEYINGHLAGYDEYDIALDSSTTPVTVGRYKWVQHNSGMALVSRASVSYITTT